MRSNAPLNFSSIEKCSSVEYLCHSLAETPDEFWVESDLARQTALPLARLEVVFAFLIVDLFAYTRLL